MNWAIGIQERLQKRVVMNAEPSYFWRIMTYRDNHPSGVIREDNQASKQHQCAHNLVDHCLRNVRVYFRCSRQTESTYHDAGCKVNFRDSNTMT